MDTFLTLNETEILLGNSQIVLGSFYAVGMIDGRGFCAEPAKNSRMVPLVNQLT